MAVSAKWQVIFAQARAWADEPGALLFRAETEYGTTLIFPDEVKLSDDEMLALIESRARDRSIARCGWPPAP